MKGMKHTIFLLLAISLLASCSSSEPISSSSQEESPAVSLSEEASSAPSAETSSSFIETSEPSLEETEPSSTETESSIEETEKPSVEIPSLGTLVLTPEEFPIKENDAYPVDAVVEKEGYTFLCNGIMQGNKNSTPTFQMRSGSRGGASLVCQVMVNAIVEVEYMENIGNGSDYSGTLSYVVGDSLAALETMSTELSYEASSTPGRRVVSFEVQNAYFALCNESANAVHGTRLTITPKN